MLTASEFCSCLRTRRSAQTLKSIGLEFGVTHAAVQRWLAGKRPPSATVLILAELLWRTPRDVGSGLPDGDGQERAG